MKCPACGFVSEDEDIFIEHLAWCKDKPLSKWETFAEYELKPLNCKSSSVYQVIQEEEDER